MRKILLLVILPVIVCLTITVSQANFYFQRNTSTIDSVIIEFNDSVYKVKPDTLFLNLHTGEKDSIKIILKNNSSEDLLCTIDNEGLKNYNYAIEFDGVNDFLNLEGRIKIARSSFTIEAWIKRYRNGIYETIWAHGDSYINQLMSFSFQENNLTNFWIYDKSINPPSDILSTTETYADTNWHHWAFTYNISTRARKIYRDGREIAHDFSKYIYKGEGFCVIGTYIMTGDFFKGIIDDIRIWRTERTPEQIRRHMFNEIRTLESNLVAYLKLNEKSGDSLWDASLNKNYGQIAEAKRVVSSAPVSVDWFKVKTNSNYISSKSSCELSFELDISGIDKGDYTDQIIISNSSHPRNIVNVPVQLKVTGVPDIQLLKDSISWKISALNQDSIRKIKIYNAGYQPLKMDRIEVNNPDFKVEPSSFRLYHHESVDIKVIHTPTLFGKSDGILTIHCSDPDTPLLKVKLSSEQLIIPQDLVIRWMLYAIFIALVLMLLIVYYQIRLKQRLNKQLEFKIAKALEIQKQQQQIIVHQAGLTSLGEMAAGITQEVNIPMQNILLTSESIEFEESKKDPDNHNVKEMVKEIYKDVDNINKLIEHIKLFAGQQKTELSDHFSVKETIIDALSMIEVKMANQKIKIDLDLQENLRDIYGNPYKFEQVIVNLMNNAGDTLDKKGKEHPSDFQKKVWIKTGQKNGNVFVRINDNGKGISLKYLPKVFLPFFTTKEPGKGIGVGLSISRDIISEMKGTLEIASSEGSGTECVINLPVDE